MEKVLVLKTGNRSKAISRLCAKFDLSDFKEKSIALKANYNSADDFPASTHLDTLSGIINALKSAGATEVTLAERSGMGKTRDVLTDMGVFKLSTKLGFRTIVLDELGEEGWVRFKPPFRRHWSRGFLIAKVFKNADKIVQTCCLKTHRFGGHFTLSLKNSVGLVADVDPEDGYSYMAELHSSHHQRRMIAEINVAYEPDLIIMDGIEAFITGGPESGEIANPSVILAAKDRVAIDAVGVGILRHFGAAKEVSEGKIFQQEQIARAAELGVGVHSAKDIQLVPLDTASEKFAKQIESILKTEG